MIKLFQTNEESGLVDFSPQALAISEFRELYERDTSPDKIQAWLDLSAAYFIASVMPDNIYKGYEIKERVELVSEDILKKSPEDVEQDQDLFRAVEKIVAIEEDSITARFLRTTIKGLNKLQNYLRNTDLEERDAVNQKPIHDPKKYLGILQEAAATSKTLRDLENSLKQELLEDSGDRIKGGGADEYNFG